MCDDACCDFLAKRLQNPDIAHRVGRCAMMHVVIFWPRDYKNRYRTSTGKSIRSMCDDARCDFLAKRIQKPISHTDWNTAVGNSRPFLTNLPFHDFPNYFNHD